MNGEVAVGRPKVVQVTVEAHQGNGGIYTAVQHIARALRAWCDHRTVNLTSREENAGGELTTVRIVRDWRGQRFGWVNRVEQGRLQSALHGADFVIIHVPYRFHAGFVADWCRRNRVPYAFIPHGAFDPYVFTYRAWQKRLWLATIGRAVILHAAFVVFTTRQEAEKARRIAPLHRREILPWPTPLPATYDRNEIRKKVLARFGMEPEGRLLVFLGRLHPMKRPAETAVAFRAAAPASWTLLFAGPEEGVTSSTLTAEGRILAPGAIFGKEKSELLAAADGLVLFSHRENFGFAVTEALAHGTPVLISDELDLAPEIEATKSGWVADGRTHEGRVQGIVEMTRSSRRECISRGIHGRAWVGDELSEAKFASALRRIVTNAVKRPAGAARADSLVNSS